jgi:AcrR family transcriptional regulator
MFSQSQPTEDARAGVSQSTASERILRSATDLFGRQGVRGTSLKAIAEQAGVSPALVVHHFGSKEGLREACDRRVVAQVRSAKTETLRQGPNPFPFAVLSQVEESRPLLRYLSRAVVDGSPHLDELLDELVDDAVVYTAEAQEEGWVRPSADPRARIVVLTLWSMGVLVLHEQLQRMLDVDLLGEGGDVLPYMQAALEILTQGVLTEDAFTQFRTTTTGSAAEADPEEGTP